MSIQETNGPQASNRLLSAVKIINCITVLNNSNYKIVLKLFLYLDTYLMTMIHNVGVVMREFRRSV